MDVSQWHLLVLVIECSLVIILNIILIVIILLKRQLRSQICNLFLVNLFFAHILEGFVGVARSSFLYSPKKKDPEKVNLSVNFFTTAIILSYLTYIPVTLDRYFDFLFQFLMTSMLLPGGTRVGRCRQCADRISGNRPFEKRTKSW